MQSILKKGTICCVLSIIISLLMVSNGFSATTGFEDEAGGPMGLAIQGTAPGEKLAGVVFLELFNFDTVDGVDVADGYAVVRLRKASIVETFYAELTDVPIGSPLGIQESIMNSLAADIKLTFFDNDQNVVLVLRTAEEFGTVNGTHTDITRDFDYTIADIVIAGK